MTHLLTLFFILAAPTARGAEPSRARLVNPNNLVASADRDKAPRLYDGVTGKPVTITKGAAFLPNRVYAIYNVEEKAWLYSLTNFYGKFSEPLEVLYPDTIVQGRFLGARIPNDHFRLNKNFGWEPTKELRRENILVLSDPPRFKRVRYTQHIEPPPKRFK